MFRDYLPWFLDTVNWVHQLFLMLSAIAVPIVAAWGYRNWRNELKGKTVFNIARRLALCTYDFESTYHEARNPFIFPSEYADRKKESSESREQSLLADEEFAWHERLASLRDSLLRMRRAKWEASIILKPEIADLINPVAKHYNKLAADVAIHFGSRRGSVGRSAPLPDPTMEGQSFSRIYKMDGDEECQALDEELTALRRALTEYFQ